MRPRGQALGGKNVIGSNVAKIRKSQGLKQKDLATKLQVSGTDICPASLSRLEGQDRYAKDYEVFAVAEALGVEITDLYSRDIIE